MSASEPDQKAEPPVASGRSRTGREPTAAEVVAGLPAAEQSAIARDPMTPGSSHDLPPDPADVLAKRRSGRMTVSPDRRAELIAAAAALAARQPQSDPPPRAPVAGVRPRLLVLGMAVVLAGAVLTVVAIRAPTSALSRADAGFMSRSLIAADQSVREQLVGLRSERIPRVLSRTRDALATARSLTVEIRDMSGRAADRVRSALRAEGDWLDAVGSTLANPRSVLREQLVARDRVLLAALGRLPGYVAPRGDASRRLLGYSLARERGAAGRGSR